MAREGQFAIRLSLKDAELVERALKELGDRGQLALNRIKAAAGASAPGLDGVGRSARLTGYQMQQLSFQVNDVVTQLASGTSVFQTFAQQGGQIVQVFGGVRGTLAAALGVINPMTVGVTALAAGVGGAALAWNSYASSSRAVEQAARSQGNAIGLTREGLEAVAQAAAEASGISVRSAREIEAVYLRAGGVGADMLAKLTGITRDYAAMTGQEAVAAAQDLARKFNDVERGAKELDAAYDILSAAQLRDIQQLQTQGRHGEAQKILFDALNARAKGFADDGLNWLERAWNAVSTAASNAADSMGRGLAAARHSGAQAEAALAVQLEDRRRALAGLEEQPGWMRRLIDPRGGREGEMRELRAEIALLEERSAALSEARRLGSQLAESQRTQADAARERDRLAARAEEMGKLNAQQERALELARMESAERAVQVARDQARVELLKRVKDATAEEIQAAEDRAEAIVRAEQATADAARQRDKAQRDAAAAAKKFAQDEEKARDADRKRVEAEIAAIERYKEAVADQIAGIRAETEMLGMNAEERAVAVEIMKAEAEARKANKELTDEERKAIEAETRARERRRAEVEAEEEARREAERQLKERQREAERATDDIVRYAGDAFADLFGDTEGGWKRMWSRMGDWARQTLARIAAEMVLRPVIAPVVNSMMGVPAAAGSAGGAAGSGFGIGDVGGVGQMLSGLGGLGGMTGALNSFGTHLGFASGLPMAAPSASFVGPMPLAQGSIFGTTTFSQFLGGVGAGFGVGTLLGSLIGRPGLGNTIGSGVGSLAGAAIGSIIPGIGTLLGGIIGGAGGGLLGSLFSKKPKDAEFQLITTPTQRGGLNSVQGPFGWVGENSFKTKGWDELGLVRATAEIDRRAAAFLSEAEIASVAAALQATPGRKQKERQLDEGDFADALRDRYGTVLRTLGAGGSALERMASAPRTAEDTARVLQELLAERGAIRDLIELTGEMGEISKTVADQVTAVTETIDKLGKSTEDWGFEAGKVAEAQRRIVEEFLGMREAAEPMSETAKALAALEKRFAESAALAREVGISEAELAAAREQALQKLAEGFDEGVRRQLLALTDPLALALEDWEKLAEQRLADARLAGANLVEVERLNALERQRIIEQAGSGLRSLIDELRFGELGGLSPTARLEDLRAEIGLAAALGDRSRFEELARPFLELSRGAFASGGQFQTDRDWVLSVAQGFLGAVPGAANGNEPVVTAISGLNEPLKTLATETARGNAAMATELIALRKQVAEMTATIGRQQAALDRIAARMTRAA